jgi:hypothetical protein
LERDSARHFELCAAFVFTGCRTETRQSVECRAAAWRSNRPTLGSSLEGCLRLADARLLPSGLECGQPATCDVVSRPSSDRLAAADICVGARKPPLLDLGNRPGRRCDRIHIGGFYRNVLGPKGRSEGCNVLVDGQGMKRHVFGKTRIGVRVFRIALLAIRNAEGADRIQTAATLIGTGSNI